MPTLRKALTVLLLGCLLLVAVPPGTGQSSSAAMLSADLPTVRDSVANQLLLGFRPGLSERKRDTIIAQRGGRLLQWFASSNTALVTLPPASASAVSAFAVDDAVLYAEPNARIYPARTPNDPRYTAGDLTSLSKIAAPEAWETTTGSPNLADGSSKVVVGVVDSGVDYTHPDLKANIWSAPAGWALNGCTVGSHGYRSDPSGTNCDPIDEFSHGTHVAGIIGAVGDNGVGVVGVSWQASIMALRVFDASGNGDTAGAVAAIDYAVQAKARGVNLRVLNISWTTPTYSQALYNQIIAAGNQNILVVAAAGNDGKDITNQAVYPANFGTHVATDPFPSAVPNLLAVAATDGSDGLASFAGGASNYSGARVHLGAPGKDILSTFPGDNYGLLSGTSMATPFVAGAAALLLSTLLPAAAAPTDLTATQLRDRLNNCGDSVAPLANTTISGKRLNIARAINGTDCATPASSPSPSLTPTPTPAPSTLLPSPSSSASPTPSPVTTTYTLATTTNGLGDIRADKPLGSLGAGTIVTLTALPLPGQMFIGWSVDDVLRSYTNPVRMTMNGNHTIVARFVAQQSFADVSAVSPAAEAINALAARGVIRGCDPEVGLFCPNNTTLRAQMAALITRAMGWDTLNLGNPFPDRHGVDDDLWRNVGTLANYGVAKGYDNDSGGKYYEPTGNVLAGQTISFITRAMIKTGYWQQQADDGSYPNVPGSSGHRADIATYIFYVKSLPDFPNTSAAFTAWDQPSTRAWFARALWAALQSRFNVESLP